VAPLSNLIIHAWTCEKLCRKRQGKNLKVLQRGSLPHLRALSKEEGCRVFQQRRKQGTQREEKEQPNRPLHLPPREKKEGSLNLSFRAGGGLKEENLKKNLECPKQGVFKNSDEAMSLYIGGEVLRGAS